jgi:hypothetical protein
VGTHYRPSLRGIALAVSALGLFLGAILTQRISAAQGQVVRASAMDAATCSQSDVQAAIDAAGEGDTVLVPDGNCTWSSAVVIDKAITLKGNGNYVVDGDHQDIGSWPLTITLSGNTGIEIEGAAGDFIRVTGFQFLGSAPGGSGARGGAIYSPEYNRADWRLDNSRFSLSGNSVTTASNSGLIDHIYVYDSGCSPAAWIVARDLRFDGLGYGAFTQPVGFGGPDFLFIEDSTFWKHCTSASQSPFATDGQAGGRFVFRHNYLRDASVGWHGTESGAPERGGYAFEVYDNGFYWTMPGNKYHTAIFHRGGTALVYNNTATNYQAIWKSWVQRATRSWGIFGQCDGTQAHDGNAGVPDAPGYPCLDQVGRGMASGTALSDIQPQEESKVYIWNNTLINTGTVSHNNPQYVVEGRDYEFSDDDSAKPAGYEAYPYPHPLTQIDSPLEGDVNRDGNVDGKDILACIDHILGVQDWGVDADVNRDGNVNVMDVQMIVGLVNRD